MGSNLDRRAADPAQKISGEEPIPTAPGSYGWCDGTPYRICKACSSILVACDDNATWDAVVAKVDAAMYEARKAQGMDVDDEEGAEDDLQGAPGQEQKISTRMDPADRGSREAHDEKAKRVGRI